MEHKVGRGWTGADGDRLRQAFLLDPPDNNRPDRRYFGGQKDPVPGMLGPADADSEQKLAAFHVPAVRAHLAARS